MAFANSLTSPSFAFRPEFARRLVADTAATASVQPNHALSQAIREERQYALDPIIIAVTAPDGQAGHVAAALLAAQGPADQGATLLVLDETTLAASSEVEMQVLAGVMQASDHDWVLVTTSALRFGTRAQAELLAVAAVVLAA